MLESESHECWESELYFLITRESTDCLNIGGLKNKESEPVILEFKESELQLDVLEEVRVELARMIRCKVRSFRKKLESESNSYKC